ncbi:MAG: hypothetical protein ACM3PW_03990 [Chlamydiota bacterium]
MDLQPLLLQAFLSLTEGWRAVFTQRRLLLRAQRQALGALLVLGRATLSRILWTNGREQCSWSADYFLHSRAKWDPQQLFAPLLKEALRYCRGPLVGVAVDDTRVRKTGRAIPQAAYHRDPMSPPFHTNLILGLRFLQASLLLPLHKLAEVSARAIPIRFEEVSTVKKPGKRADAAAREQYRIDQKRFSLSQRSVASMAAIRAALDCAGAQLKTLVIAGDGSFCNRTVLAGLPARTELISRTRKDAKLCLPALGEGRRIYSAKKFSPEQVRQDQCIPWHTTKLFYGGKRRALRYKEISGVLWQSGARTRPLRLFVIAPTPYRKRQTGRWYYRQPAYLLCTELTSTALPLLQIYFDRWQIEVNHREEKDTLGVGQAQLRNPNAVPRQPALVVAAYSALLLAALKVFGVLRGPAFPALPRWRRNAKRASCLDLLTMLRNEASNYPQLLQKFGIATSAPRMIAAAAA